MCNCLTSTKYKGYITKSKIIITKLWEKSQFEEKPMLIKKINKL